MKTLLLILLFIPSFLNAQVFLGMKVSDVYENKNSVYNVLLDYPASLNDTLYITAFPSYRDTINVGTIIYVNLRTDVVFKQVFMYNNPSKERLIKDFSFYTKHYRTSLMYTKPDECYIIIE